MINLVRVKTLILCILALSIIGCAATKLNNNATGVLVSNDHKVPNGCKYLGQVIGNQGNSFTGGLTSNSAMAIGSMDDLRNKTANLGGNYVQLLTNQASYTGSGDDGFGGSFVQTNVTNIGNAYNCPESAINMD